MSGADSFPKPLKNIISLLHKLLRPQARNVFLDDEFDHLQPQANPRARPPHPDIVAGFKRAAASMRNDTIKAPLSVLTPAYTAYEGVRYSTNSRHKGNSSIIVAGSGGTHIPMVIDTIIQDASPPHHVFMAVKRVKAVNIDNKAVDIDDPFEAYPVLGAKIWSRRDNLSSELEVVHAAEITSHFMSCEIQVETGTGSTTAAVILPLHKVCRYFFQIQAILTVT